MIQMMRAHQNFLSPYNNDSHLNTTVQGRMAALMGKLQYIRLI